MKNGPLVTFLFIEERQHVWWSFQVEDLISLDLILDFLPGVLGGRQDWFGAFLTVQHMKEKENSPTSTQSTAQLWPPSSPSLTCRQRSQGGPPCPGDMQVPKSRPPAGKGRARWERWSRAKWHLCSKDAVEEFGAAEEDKNDSCHVIWSGNWQDLISGVPQKYLEFRGLFKGLRPRLAVGKEPEKHGQQAGLGKLERQTIWPGGSLVMW